MKISYDEKYDIAYIKFLNKKPDGAIEIDEGIVIDTTSNNEIVGIEIFNVKKRFPINTLYQFEVSKHMRTIRRGKVNI